MTRQSLDSGQYDSVESFLDAVAMGPVRDENAEPYRTYMHEGRRSWYDCDCDTGKDVVVLVSRGWPRGMALVADLIEKTSAATAMPIDRRRRLVRSDSGDSVDIHAVWRGQLDKAWSKAVRRNTRGPQRIDLVANMLCSGGDEATVLAWRGAAAVAIADRLTAAGYAVRIVVGFGGRCNGATVNCRITVKDHGGPLDEATAASVIMPGFFRALGHAWTAAHHPKIIDSPSMTVGIVSHDESEIFISHEVNDERTALAKVDSVIASINAGVVS